MRHKTVAKTDNASAHGGVVEQERHGAAYIADYCASSVAPRRLINDSFHVYQSELFPTSIRARAVGFVYSWSRFSAIFTAFLIAAVLKEFGTTGVFVFIAGAMLTVMLATGLMGPRTKGLELEKISH